MSATRATAVVVFLASAILEAGLVADVRQAIASRDFAGGEKLIEQYRKTSGTTPEMILALSWLGRGALANHQLDAADRYAAETRKLCLEALKTRRMDDEKDLPLAFGASMEVQAQVLRERGQRSEGLVFLKRELARYRDTSIRTRIQKNIHLLSLEGQPAPAIATARHVGTVPPKPLSSLRGSPVILFFWAHWCGDCKYQAPILARLESEFGGKGLKIVGATQRYGYAARGEEVSPDAELAYIEEIRRKFYSEVRGMSTPVDEETFRNYGASTTPTLVLIDRQGIVRMYQPGKMPYEELAPRVKALVEAGVRLSEAR
ncbi:MAG: TlpA family protein disulfide reductase [Bryobacteraceae bacterium]